MQYDNKMYIKQRNNTSFKIKPYENKTKNWTENRSVWTLYDLRETMLPNHFKIRLVVMLCKVVLFVCHDFQNIKMSHCIIDNKIWLHTGKYIVQANIQEKKFFVWIFTIGRIILRDKENRQKYLKLTKTTILQ